MTPRRSSSTVVLVLALIAGLCLGAVVTLGTATIPPAAAASRLP